MKTLRRKPEPKDISHLFPNLDPSSIEFGFRQEGAPTAIVAGTDTFDSELLHLRIARVLAAQAQTTVEFVELYRDLASQLSQAAYDQIVRRIAADNLSEAWALEQAGFELMDVGLVFARHLADPLPIPSYNDLIVRHANQTDIDCFAPSMTRDPWGSRYEADPGYDEQDVRQLRIQWLRNSLNGRAALFLVGQNDSNIAGYVTGLLDNEANQGEIELVGTLPEFRGRRIASRILKYAIAWYSTRVDLLTVRTQATNFPAANLYEGLDFKLYRSDLTYRCDLRNCKETCR